MPEQKTVNYISFADLNQLEEEILEGYRGEKDANARIKPLLHDNYQVRVSFRNEQPDERWVLSDKGAFWVQVSHTTEGNANPEHDGRTVTEMVSTAVNKQGTTTVQKLLQGLGIDTTLLTSAKSQVMVLNAALDSGAMTIAELDWVARLYDESVPRRDRQGNPVVSNDGAQLLGQDVFVVRGMCNFPKDANGEHVAEITNEDNPRDMWKQPIQLVQSVPAYNFVRRYVYGANVAQAPEAQPVEAVAASAKVTQAVKAAPSSPAAAASPKPPVRRIPVAR